MGKDYVLTITAANRIGILAAVSNAVAELGGDMRELSVSVMNRFFTIIIAAEFPAHREPDVITDHLRDMGRPYGLEIVIKDPESEELQNEPKDGTATYYLTLNGKNQTGLMRLVASRLAQEEIDISDLYALSDKQPGNFMMILELIVPPAADLERLVSGMEQLHDTSTIAVQLHTAEDFQTAGSARPLRTMLSE